VSCISLNMFKQLLWIVAGRFVDLCRQICFHQRTFAHTPIPDAVHPADLISVIHIVCGTSYSPRGIGCAYCECSTAVCTCST
jgi:hypothetical protein